MGHSVATSAGPQGEPVPPRGLRVARWKTKSYCCREKKSNCKSIATSVPSPFVAGTRQIEGVSMEFQSDATSDFDHAPYFSGLSHSEMCCANIKSRNCQMRESSWPSLKTFATSRVSDQNQCAAVRASDCFSIRRWACFAFRSSVFHVFPSAREILAN